MTPEQISVITSLTLLLDRLGGWPLWMIFLVIIIGPWILAMLLSYLQMKRFETVVKMYESNVDLVKKYETLATDLKDVVILNTQTMTRLVDRLDGSKG